MWIIDKLLIWIVKRSGYLAKIEPKTGRVFENGLDIANNSQEPRYVLILEEK